MRYLPEEPHRLFGEKIGTRRLDRFIGNFWIELTSVVVTTGNLLFNSNPQKKSEMTEFLEEFHTKKDTNLFEGRHVRQTAPV